MNYVDNKVVLITGASSGIGESTARLLASQGAIVVLAARRTDRLESIVADIQASGGKACFHALDVTNLDNFKAIAEKTYAEFGRIDVLFNNAGIMPISRLDTLKIDEWNNTIDVNIKGVLNGIASVLPVMEKAGKGQIINTSSVAGHHVWPMFSVYCATKHAVLAISEGLRQETQNVRVTVISPGAVTTELKNSISDETGKALVDEFLKTATLTPDAIARAVSYAIGQPDDVDVNEIIVRPVKQAF